ncbi:glycosyltransferase [Microcoleus sp. herbarium12]|uniref:glycosyltransferase n=1 Tax=Microcoleus sp. herbarium12 TaxID=3055437 RepID=UPI002FD546F0
MIKHILLSTDDPGVGGAAQCNHSLLCGLVKLGYQITCIQPQASNLLITSQQQLGIQHIWLENYTVDFFKQTLNNLLYLPDLIICSNSCPFSNLAAKQAAIQLEIPYIIIEHLVEPHLAEQFPQAYLAQLSHHYALAKSVIAVSHDNLGLLHQLFKLPKYQGKVIYNGRPSQYFTPRNFSDRDRLRQEFSIPLDAVVCFTAARIEERKGYQYQLEAIRQLVPRPVWSKIYFVWAGGGIFEPQLEQELKKSVQQLEITDKVKFLGQISNISEWLDAADIFVFTSKLEGMPLCVMEAMAKALPVIATGVSGIPEELGNTGKLLPDPKIDSQATIRELVTTIEDWVVNPDLRQSIGLACQQRAEQMFREERMIQETVKVIEGAMLPFRDYVSPGFDIVQPDNCFPNMIVGDATVQPWVYLRREIPHNWYVDQRQATVGFLSRDEAHILYNTALKFKGKKALEIGCWLGWSACHLALAGVQLDVVDPLLSLPDFYESVTNSLTAAGIVDSVNLVAGCSPQKVDELAAQFQRKWSLIFIDGNHESPGPLEDAISCEQLAEADALILFHDLASPDVAQGLDYLRDKGWQTLVYQTMQIMGVAWRGNIEPVKHQPDSKINWKLPKHLHHYSVSGLSQDSPSDEFIEIINAVRPYTLLSEARLFSLYSLAKQVCLNDIPGNFVECGTCKGGAAALLAVVIQRYSLRPRLLYAFDTFEGMPDPTEVDRHNGIPANETGWGAGTLKAPILENLDKICELLQVKDIVVPVQGLFAQTLPEYKSDIGRIAFLHADGDWYESTMDIFQILYDVVVPNGFIQVDDYGHWEGCKKAVHDFEQLRCESFSLTTIDSTGVWFQKNQKPQHLSPVIIIDGVFFQLFDTGIARVWKSLLQEWTKTDFAQHIIILDRGGTAPKISGYQYRLIPPYLSDSGDPSADREMLEQICIAEEASLFISTYYTTPISTPSVFMAYDMVPEVMAWDMNRPLWQDKHHAIRHASSYLAISDNTANDLVRFFPEISRESIEVAHCGVESIFTQANNQEINEFKNNYGLVKPYFLLVGLRGGYKNGILFFQAFTKLENKDNFSIVCVGGGDELEEEFAAYVSETNVHLLPHIDDAELRVAYSGATALVYPSKYEGFGLPILEAMACGCPVITCPLASIPEVGKDAVLYVNDDVDEMAIALRDIQIPDVRESLIAAGLEQASKFSWSQMAETVSSVLIEATLLPLQLSELNLIVFPDWEQSENTLYSELSSAIVGVLTHPEKNRITLLIDTSNLRENSEIDANLIVSDIVMNLLMQQELDGVEESEITLIGKLSAIQWKALLPCINYRVVLENENQQAVLLAGAGNLPVWEDNPIASL